MSKRALRAALIALLLLPIGQAWTAAEEPGSADRYGLALSETSLTGVLASSYQYFQVPSYWEVQQAKLRLDYRVTPLAQGDRSSVTLYINGQPFHSFRPDPEDGASRQIEVDIPRSGLIDGVNTLLIEGAVHTAQGVDSNGCLPTETRGSWLQIYDTSHVELKYVKSAFQGGISAFHERFIGLDAIAGQHSAVALPEKGEPAELEAALYALSGLARASATKERTIPLIAYGSEEMAGKEGIVLIALYDRLPDPVRAQLGESRLEDRALIQLVPVQEVPTLVVTSANPEMLVKAGRLIANQSLMGQMDGDRKMVDEGTEVDTPAVTISQNVPLTETGDMLKGAMHREKSYFISLPGNRSIAEASKIGLDFRYASNLDFDRSLLTVLVNGTPIGSKKLSAELADGDSIELTLPKNLGISGNFTITAAFDLEIDNASCIQNQDQMPWAFIEKSSLLQVHTRDQTDLLFNNYPYPFLRDGSYNRVAVVLPQEHNRFIYPTLSNLFNLLGQFAVTNTGKVSIYDDSVSAEQLKDSQIIAIGSYRDNKLIRDNNSRLYFQYGDGGAGFRSNEKMSIDSSYGERIGSLQLIESPYGSGHGMMAVTGPGPEQVYLASGLIAAERDLFKIFGDGVVTDKDGHINAYRFKVEAEPEKADFLDEVLERSDAVGFLVALMLVLLLVLVSLILLIRKHRKRRRDNQ